jgi:hypothetical protein
MSIDIDFYLCLQETLIFADGSVVKTTSGITKTLSNDLEAEDGDDETHRPQGSHVSGEVVEISQSDDDKDPYITPFLLEKKKGKLPAPQADDTEGEESDIEQQLRGKASKKAAGVSGSNNKVR